MQWLGLLHRFQKKDLHEPGTGVVTSPGVYRKLTGYILVLRGVVRRDGHNGNVPRPFVVVASGKTTMGCFGYFLIRVSRSTRRASGGGWYCGRLKARSTAENKEMRWTSRVVGNDTVKIGSKSAARYKRSIGEVSDEAMTD